MKKDNKHIPVYNIQALDQALHARKDFVAEPFAYYLQSHPILHIPHRHSFYHMLLFTKGSGTHTIDFEQFTARAGQIYFMAPGQVHSWHLSNDTDGYVINFTDSFFQPFLLNANYLDQFRFLRGIATDSVIDLPGEACRQATDIMLQIIDEMAGNAPMETDYIRLLLLQLFILVSRTNSQEGNDIAVQHNQLVLSNFRQLVDKFYAEKRLPKEYAAMLYITPNHLNALCKDLLGKPAGTVIRDRILLEAKRLLVNAQQSIAEIAYQLQFTDPAHFSRFFKKHTLTTPEAFRKAATSAK